MTLVVFLRYDMKGGGGEGHFISSQVLELRTVFYVLFFSFWVTTGNAVELLLALHQEITPGSAGGPYVILGI